MSEPATPQQENAASAVRASKIVPLLVVTVLILCGVFGWRTVKARRDFDAYRQSSLVDSEAKLPWKQGALGVEACIDFSIAWTLACPAMDTWCHGYMPDVLGRCLDSQERADYCTAKAEAMALTSYGYPECEERVSRVDQKYRKRATKKICAAAHRAVVAHCTR